MKVCVVGLWHLGCVTAACLAERGHSVIGYDPDAGVTLALAHGRAPLHEPGLNQMIRSNIGAGRLAFSHDPAVALDCADIVWITFDTRIDENDEPQSQEVVDQVRRLLPMVPDGCLVLVSSPMEVGRVRRLCEYAARDGLLISFGYIPENLRLGKALDVFMRPDRVVVGLERDADKRKVEELFAPFAPDNRLVVMGLESAEMVKHGINSFLSTSIALMNEIATVCERVGADAKDVERGLKTESRIGPKAYLSPGAAFAGGTLARDLTAMRGIGGNLGLSLPVIAGALESNRAHSRWPMLKLVEAFGDVRGRRIGVLGLAYKPGTDTLRRSASVELIESLRLGGVDVAPYDPAMPVLLGLPSGPLMMRGTAAEVIEGSNAVVVMSSQPAFRDLPWHDLIGRMAQPVVVDANWSLADVIFPANIPVRYFAVGRGGR